MTKKPSYISACAFVLGSCLVAAPAVRADDCSAQSSFSTLKRNVLTVSTAIVPPFSFTSTSGQYEGLDSKVLKKFAAENCLTLEVVTTDSASVIQYLVSGRSDIAAGGWYRTAERAKVIGVSDPIYIEPAAIYSKEGYKSFSELSGLRVGTVQGYTWVADLKAIFGKNLKLYPTAVALTQDLSSGRIDAAINSLAIGIEAKRQGAIPAEYSIITAGADGRVRSSVNPAQTSLLFSKENPELGEALNKTISGMRAEGALVGALKEYSIPAEAANTGAARYADQ